MNTFFKWKRRDPLSDQAAEGMGEDIAPVLFTEVLPVIGALVPPSVTTLGGGLSPPGLVQKVTEVRAVLPALLPLTLLPKKTCCGYFAAWLDMKVMQPSIYAPCDFTINQFICVSINSPTPLCCVIPFWTDL